MELLRQDGGLEQLKEWLSELALKFERMLMEHHHIFSLDKNEIGCTDTAEHIIELMDDEPFKERFRRIAPPLLEEVLRESTRHVGRRGHPALEITLV